MPQLSLERSGLHNAALRLLCPPPIGPHQAERLSRLFISFTKYPPHEYDEWELTLTCDHLVRARQHRSNGGWNNCGVVARPTCEITRGIVQSTLIGPAVGPEERPVVELQRLQTELEQAEKQAARRRAAAEKAEQHLAALKSRLELSWLQTDRRKPQSLPEP